MNHLIGAINWIEGGYVIDSSLESLTVKAMDSGLEAAVFHISNVESNFVLKVWNRTSKPNVELQYKLLGALYNHGISVSHPMGWGFDKEMNPVLLTSWDGVPVQKVNHSVFTSLANMLTGIHRVPIEQFDSFTLPRHDFISYFYPAIEDHPDIKILLEQLVEDCDMKQERLIHGDFNLGNVLYADGKYTVIDWTNGQLGDPRYDIAWAVVLVRIYVGEKYGTIFQASFLANDEYSIEELELFEAIACLRWVLLYRIADLPKGKDTIKRVRNILKRNKYLSEAFI